jgi:hypothetical protein
VLALEKEIRHSGLPTTEMAQNSSNFYTWSSSSEATNLGYKFGTNSNMGSAVSTDVGQSSGQQMERVTAIHYPTRVQIQRPYMLGSVDPRYDSGQVLGLQSGYNDIPNDLMSEFHEVSPLERTHAAVIDRIPNRTRSLPEEVFPSSLDHRVEAPERVKTGRRRRISGNGAPDGWVASKNLISERRRREKLQKGLITLRELVPMFNRKVSFT